MNLRILVAGLDISLSRAPNRSGLRMCSSVLVCPRCVQKWAVMQLADSEGFHVRGELCEACSPLPNLAHQGCVAGSILGNEWYPQHIDEALLEALPPALLEREFNLHWSQYATTQSLRPLLPLPLDVPA